MLVWIVGNIWWKPVPTHAISVVLALVASVNSVNFVQRPVSVSVGDA